MIVKIFEETHNYFTGISYYRFYTLLCVSSNTFAFGLYKQEELSFVV